MIKFFPEHTNWYKGNLHSHTTNSDGAWTPDEAVEHYKANRVFSRWRVLIISNIGAVAE